jgi:hypothetical protein
MIRNRIREEWFDAYAAAMLEGDRNRIPERVKRAQQAIESRLAKIDAGEAARRREQVDLQYALRYLRLLSRPSVEY